jgi:SOS response regulatory protein OraA/RecX
VSGPKADCEHPRLTALRRVRPGSVALEVDGRPWRVVPDEVVVRTGLTCGALLDRPVLRRFRAELRRAEALRIAGRQVARRDLPRQRLEERLRSRGVRRADAAAAVDTLARAGAVDDERLARVRASSLAERGWGNAAISARLREAGISVEATEGALAELAGERVRAVRLVVDLPVRKAVAVLARRGFDPDLVEEWTAGLDVEG